jgi:hypothetical protein
LKGSTISKCEYLAVLLFTPFSFSSLTSCTIFFFAAKRTPKFHRLDFQKRMLESKEFLHSKSNTTLNFTNLLQEMFLNARKEEPPKRDSFDNSLSAESFSQLERLVLFVFFSFSLSPFHSTRIKTGCLLKLQMRPTSRAPKKSTFRVGMNNF